MTESGRGSSLCLGNKIKHWKIKQRKENFSFIVFLLFLCLVPVKNSELIPLASKRWLRYRGHRALACASLKALCCAYLHVENSSLIYSLPCSLNMLAELKIYTCRLSTSFNCEILSTISEDRPTRKLVFSTPRLCFTSPPCKCLCFLLNSSAGHHGSTIQKSGIKPSHKGRARRW